MWLPVSGLERCPGCHPERLAVILSAAQDLCVRRARPCAEFTLSEANGLRVTGLLSKCPSRALQRCNKLRGRSQGYWPLRPVTSAPGFAAATVTSISSYFFTL